MKSDRELLELAAKAAGIDIVWYEPERKNAETWCFIPRAKAPHNRRASDIDGGEIWNPLVDDGDALRLACKLRLDITHLRPFGASAEHTAGKLRSGYVSDNDHGGDHYAATRHAIVRAAAAIGEKM